MGEGGDAAGKGAVGSENLAEGVEVFQNATKIFAIRAGQGTKAACKDAEYVLLVDACDSAATTCKRYPVPVSDWLACVRV